MQTARHALSWLLLAACQPGTEPVMAESTPAASAAVSASPATATPPYTASSDAGSARAPETTAPVTASCNADQTNTPCVYLDVGRCMLRRSNCTAKPCTEPAPQPVPCPTPPPPLFGDACRRMAACVGVSDEGCCIGCDHPMRTRISRRCADALERARDCDAVRAAQAAACKDTR